MQGKTSRSGNVAGFGRAFDPVFQYFVFVLFRCRSWTGSHIWVCGQKTQRSSKMSKRGSQRATKHLSHEPVFRFAGLYNILAFTYLSTTGFVC
uniref:Uncharacterized protein n=1 Tax=Physcomitrium patens TaxID=3218 RepID=A0A7I3ZPK6_PHYPA